MQLEGSLPCSHEPFTFPYSKLYQSSSYPSNWLLEDTFQYFFHPRLGLPSGLFHSVFLTKTLYESRSASVTNRKIVSVQRTHTCIKGSEWKSEIFRERITVFWDVTPCSLVARYQRYAASIFREFWRIGASYKRHSSSVWVKRQTDWNQVHRDWKDTCSYSRPKWKRNLSRINST
jgi:hypothetical protein